MGVAPPWSCHALVFLAPNSWDHELSADISFVSVLAMVLSEYWKKIEEIFFWSDLTLRRLWKLYHFEKKISSLFKYFERTIDRTGTNDTSAESSWSELFGARRKRAWHDQEGATLTCRKRTLKKKANLTELIQDAKKNFSIQFLICLCYELIACPLLLNSNNVYFTSSVIAKPI